MDSNRAISQSLLWRFISFFTSLIITLLVARTFGPVASGEVNYFVAIASLVVLLSSFNLDAAIIHFTAAGKIQLNKLLTLSIFIVLLSAVVYFIFSIYWTGKNRELHRYAQFFALCRALSPGAAGTLTNYRHFLWQTEFFCAGTCDIHHEPRADRLIAVPVQQPNRVLSYWVYANIFPGALCPEYIPVALVKRKRKIPVSISNAVKGGMDCNNPVFDGDLSHQHYPVSCLQD